MVNQRFHLILFLSHLLPVQLVMYTRVFLGLDNMDELDAFGFGQGIFFVLDVGEKVHCHLGHTNSRGDGMSWTMALEDSMLRIQLHFKKSLIVSNISIDYFEEILK